MFSQYVKKYVLGTSIIGINFGGVYSLIETKKNNNIPILIKFPLYSTIGGIIGPFIPAISPIILFNHYNKK